MGAARRDVAPVRAEHVGVYCADSSRFPEPCGRSGLKTSTSEGEQPVAKLMSKSELIEKLAGHSDGLSKKNVREVLEGLAAIAYKELKKSGAFLVPGLAKFVVIKKPATKAREGINPFTKEPTIFKAKPARKLIKARPVKAAKDALL
jgi:nucleoid DNA-binding protein